MKYDINLMAMSFCFLAGCSLGVDKQLQQHPEQGTGTIGLKNVRQMAASYYAVTGVSRTNGNVRNAYNTVAGLFLTDNDVRKVSGPTLIAATALAGAFCDQFLVDEQGRTVGNRMAHNSVNFSAGYASLSEATRAEVITRYAELFWQRQPLAEELSMLTGTLSSLYEGISSTSGTEMRRGLLGVCAMMLSSFESIKN
ncbi:MAG: hypothetical protein AB7P04_09145 [Bacteriovoracia bacterium]